MSDSNEKKEVFEESIGSIRRSRRSRSRKPKKNQIIPGIFVFAVIAVIGIILASVKPMLGFFWITGNAFGCILQRARFCFTASLRDPYLTGGTTLTKAVLTAFAITSIGFIAIQYGAVSRGLPMPGSSYVVPVSAATAIGAFMFGTGMVIAGGCASGTCMRVGEGFHMQILSLFFFVLGSLWGAHDFGWWKLNVILKGKAVYLPDVFGWTGAVLIQLLTIVLLWIAADKWGKKKGAESH